MTLLTLIIILIISLILNLPIIGIFYLVDIMEKDMIKFEHELKKIREQNRD